LSEIIVTIQDLSRAGSGVARLESGEVVFVPFTCPGDVVEIRIVERQKNYLQAEYVRFIKPAEARVTPACPVFEKCGGCALQHIPYPLQFSTKKKGLLHALQRAGVHTEAIPVDELPADQSYGYRNRIQLRGSVAEKNLGYFARGSQTLVAIDHCPIADRRINEALPHLLNEGLQKHKRDFKVEIGLDAVGEMQVAWNQSHAALGFRQINDAQNLKLQAWVAAHSRPAEHLLDLYGGAGNLSLGLAERYPTIDCVDIRVPKTNPQPNYQFHRSDVGRWIQDWRITPASASVILDPPREGLGHDFAKIAAKLDPLNIESLILVGCDVDSFVRDTHRWVKHGFQLVRLGVLDLFPQTPHVESLALFSKRPLE
jgi:23S rRNA (uracil1939-C5)-methyltransferase